MKPILVAILGVVSLVNGATPCALAGRGRQTREDGDHRYRLEVTLAQPTAGFGDVISTMFCISSARDARVEACLGQFQGHWYHQGDNWMSTFTLRPDGDNDDMCRCERPLVLTRGEPVCWPMRAPLPNVDAGSVEIGGFVTVLEDVHEIGRTADSCIDVRSVTVPLTIEPERTHDETPERTESDDARVERVTVTPT